VVAGGGEVGVDQAPSGQGLVGLPVAGDGLVAFGGFDAAFGGVARSQRRVHRSMAKRKVWPGPGTGLALALAPDRLPEWASRSGFPSTWPPAPPARPSMTWPFATNYVGASTPSRVSTCPPANSRCGRPSTSICWRMPLQGQPLSTPSTGSFMSACRHLPTPRRQRTDQPFFRSLGRGFRNPPSSTTTCITARRGKRSSGPVVAVPGPSGRRSCPGTSERAQQLRPSTVRLSGPWARRRRDRPLKVGRGPAGSGRS
jgi:hypothetical protein